MTDSNSNVSKSNKPKSAAARRRILKTLLAGGGVIAGAKALPEKWAKPVVESVVLPAHAQGSPVTAPQVFTTGAMPPTGPGPAKSVASDLLDMIIPPAEAEVVCKPIPTFELTLEVVGSNVNTCFSYPNASLVASIPGVMVDGANNISDFGYTGTGAGFCAGMWSFYDVVLTPEVKITGNVDFQFEPNAIVCTEMFDAPLVAAAFTCVDTGPMCVA